MDLTIWLGFVAASTVLLLLPGPTVILVASYAMAHGRRVALATVAGVALGDFVAMSASLLGLGALVLASAQLFTLLKWVGAAYLVYLGVKLWRSAPGATLDSLAPKGALSARGVFGHAFAVTALNPKSIAFFIAFVPQFIRPADPLAPQFAILIATFVGLAALNVLVYALVADMARARLTRPGVLPTITRLGGGVLVLMGLLTAATRRGV